MRPGDIHTLNVPCERVTRDHHVVSGGMQHQQASQDLTAMRVKPSGHETKEAAAPEMDSPLVDRTACAYRYDVDIS